MPQASNIQQQYPTPNQPILSHPTSDTQSFHISSPSSRPFSFSFSISFSFLLSFPPLSIWSSQVKTSRKGVKSSPSPPHLSLFFTKKDLRSEPANYLINKYPSPPLPSFQSIPIHPRENLLPTYL